jgi:hypothetical protein
MENGFVAPARTGHDIDRWGHDRKVRSIVRALLVGAAVPLVALGATAVYLASLKEIDDGLEGLMIVPILFVLGVLAPFAVTPSPDSLLWLNVGAASSASAASTALGIGPAAGFMFVVFTVLPGVAVGSIGHDVIVKALSRHRANQVR